MGITVAGRLRSPRGAALRGLDYRDGQWLATFQARFPVMGPMRPTLAAMLRDRRGFAAFAPSAGDGYVQCNGATYADAQGGTGALSAATGATTAYCGQVKMAANDFRVFRGFLSCNTSAIGAGGMITAASFFFVPNADVSATDFNATAVSSTASDPPTTADFGSCGTTSYGSASTSGIVVGSYVEIPFNATGIAAINKTGVTPLCLRSDRDIAATEPTGNEYITWRTTDYAGTGSDPYLSVTWGVSILVNLESMTRTVGLQTNAFIVNLESGTRTVNLK